MPTNRFHVNELSTTGLAVLSGNSLNAILTVTGESGTNLVVLDDVTSNLLLGITGDTGAVVNFNQDSVNFYKPVNLTGNTTIDGAFAATSKSFDIPHPTKDGFRLRYGSLEGPEFGVYVRGLTKQTIINLPDYWTELVDENTITVHLTPFGKNNPHWVEKIENNQVEVNSESGEIFTFYIIHGERKDISKLLVIYKQL
jgi:hypothetical protein